MDKKEVTNKENESKINRMQSYIKSEKDSVSDSKKEIKKHISDNKDEKKIAKEHKREPKQHGAKMNQVKNEEQVIREISYRNNASEKKKDIKVSASRKDDKAKKVNSLRADERKSNVQNNIKNNIKRDTKIDSIKDSKSSTSRKDDNKKNINDRLRTSDNKKNHHEKKERVITRFSTPFSIEEEEQITKSKVTDFDEAKKVAKANEKKRKKEQYIQDVKDRIEQLQTPKAKICITAILVVICFFVFVALTVINDIEIDEGKHYTEEQVKRMVVKNIFDYNSVYLFLKYRYSEHEAIPFVEYIDVEWINKNTVKIKVYDKNIIGCTSFMNEYVYFDKDGYVVETSSKKEKDILYITGIEFEELALNSRIKVDDEKIFDTILTITQQISKYKLEVDELKFDKNFDLTLYSGEITVLLGKQEAYDEQLAKLKSLLEEAKKENLSGVLHMEKYKEGQDRIIFDKN